MAIKYDAKKAEENSAKSNNNEEYHITSGAHVVNLVSYAELGKHIKMFKGKPAVYASGKNQGKVKPAETFVGLIFEFSNAAYTGDYPHAYITSMFFDGTFINGLSVSDQFVNNTLSPQFANKMSYKKFLDAINLHYGTSFQGLDEAVGMALAVKVDTVAVYEQDGKKIRCADHQVPGYDPEKKHVNVPGVKYYTTIKPECIIPMKQDFGGQIIDMSVNISEPKGTYTPVFDWDSPTKAAWSGLKSFQKNAIVAAENFRESAFAKLVLEDDELQKEVADIRQGNTGREERDNEAKDIPKPGNSAQDAGGTAGVDSHAPSGAPQLPCD